jgi:hypothetical protein
MKTFYIRYSLQWLDGISEFKGFILAEDKVDAMQKINQISFDLKADDKFIDIVEEANNFDWDLDIYEAEK